jgi:AraC-like DNA-binding protein
MKKEVRTVCFDEELRIEAYHFMGIMQPFPNHFHEYYVIGFVEEGQRRLSCRNIEYTINKGNIVLFNPGDNHACVQSDEGTFDYRGFNISKQVMLDLAEEVTGREELPGFSRNVVYDEELTSYLRPLHQMIMSGSSEFEKEENMLLMISLILERYGQPFMNCIPELKEEIEAACNYMEQHYTEHIYLDQICQSMNLSKPTLLRAFTKYKGITPYRYLQTIRINKAKGLLELGVPPIEAALQTGFSDQSHFTNFFHMFIGLSPGVYRDIFLDKGHATAPGENHNGE